MTDQWSPTIGASIGGGTLALARTRRADPEGTAIYLKVKPARDDGGGIYLTEAEALQLIDNLTIQLIKKRSEGE